MTAWFLVLMICDNSGCISQIAPIAPFMYEEDCVKEGLWRKFLARQDKKLAYFECVELPLER